MAKRTCSVCTSESKAEAVRLAQTGNGNIAATARDLEIDVMRLRDWLRRASTKEPDSSSLSPSEMQELLQLRRDVSVWRIDRIIFKKAAAFFAKDNQLQRTDRGLSVRFRARSATTE